MLKVKIGISPVNDGEIVSATMSKERKRGDTWTVEDNIVILSDEPGAERIILLEDNQRLVFSGTHNVKVVLDKEQNAAVQVPVTPTRNSTGLDTDGDESPRVEAVELAKQPANLARAMEEERRAAAITAARQKLGTTSTPLGPATAPTTPPPPPEPKPPFEAAPLPDWTKPKK